MENKIELLKKLGFSDDYLEFVINKTDENNDLKEIDQYVSDIISFSSSDIVYPIIEKTEKPVNNCVN